MWLASAKAPIAVTIAAELVMALVITTLDNIPPIEWEINYRESIIIARPLNGGFPSGYPMTRRPFVGQHIRSFRGGCGGEARFE